MMSGLTHALHDQCVQTANRHKADLTADEHRLLNIVASGWAADLPVTRQQLDAAIQIIARYRVEGS